MRITKETPNTPNVQVWPEGYQEIGEKSSRTSRQKISKEELEEKKEYRRKMRWLEWLEYYLFVIGGSVLWCYIVKRMLKWLKFPVHRHPMEVASMYIVPIIIMISVVYILDRRFTVTDTTGESEEKEE